METKKQNIMVYAALILMAALSFSNLLKIEIDGEILKPAGILVILGVIVFFVTRDSKTAGLDIKALPGQFKNKKAVIFALIPIINGIVEVIVEKRFFPEMIEHVKGRVSFLDPSKIGPLFIELVVLALGEEIAMRGFFQRQTAKHIGTVPAIILTSVLFAMGHFTFADPIIEILDLASIFIDSIFFGLAFKETDNAWFSWTSHFLANVLVLTLIYFI